MLEPSRLVLARRHLGLSASALATQLGVSAQSVHNYESGTQQPSPRILSRLADLSGLPAPFFCRSAVDELTAEEVTFRARTKMTAKVRDACLSSAHLAIELRECLLAQFRLPSVDVATLEGPISPSMAADYVRTRWGLDPNSPAPNMIHLLESKGVAIFSLPPLGDKLDAFAFWRDDKPYICLTTSKTPERSRFDAAHELGHLVLHQELDCSDKRAIEKEANQFAASFLMPALGIRRRVAPNATTDAILREKRYWGVAAMALTYRLHELSLLSDWAYKSNIMALGRLGFRSREPKGIEREGSLLFQKVLAGKDGPLNLKRIVAASGLSSGIIGELTFGVRPTLAPGRRISDSEKGHVSTDSRGLKLVT